MMAKGKSMAGHRDRKHPRSIPVDQWPDTDRRRWDDACRPGSLLKSGGDASRLGQRTRDRIAWCYGAFLGFLHHSCRLDGNAEAPAQVTPSNVEAYIAELTDDVGSVTVTGYIGGLHR